MSKIDETKTIYTDDGTPLPWLEKDVNYYLDKTTLIFGGSGSGKTTLIEEILHICKKFIPNYLVIAPKTSDHAYRKKLPANCIKEDLTKSLLQKIWTRQVNATQIYGIANDTNILAGLFEKCPDKKAFVMAKAIMHRAETYINDVKNSTVINFAQKKSQISTVEEMRNNRIMHIYKTTIITHKDYLMGQQLNDKEKIALEYLNFNPRLMIIIDDCSEKFKGWMKLFKPNEANIFECVFYKGRWNFITFIFAAHDDKLVATELRRGSRVTVFANSQSLMACMNRTQSGYTKQERNDAMKFAAKIFTPADAKIKSHQKLCYIREDNIPFRYTIADLYPEFTLGCTPLYDLTNKLPKLADKLEDNPYLKSIITTEKKKVKKSTDW